MGSSWPPSRRPTAPTPTPPSERGHCRHMPLAASPTPVRVAFIPDIIGEVNVKYIPCRSSYKLHVGSQSHKAKVTFKPRLDRTLILLKQMQRVVCGRGRGPPSPNHFRTPDTHNCPRKNGQMAIHATDRPPCLRRRALPDVLCLLLCTTLDRCAMEQIEDEARETGNIFLRGKSLFALERDVEF